jgi:hypothetical protein
LDVRYGDVIIAVAVTVIIVVIGARLGTVAGILEVVGGNRGVTPGLPGAADIRGVTPGFFGAAVVGGRGEGVTHVFLGVARVATPVVVT